MGQLFLQCLEPPAVHIYQIPAGKWTADESLSVECHDPNANSIDSQRFTEPRCQIVEKCLKICRQQVDSPHPVNEHVTTWVALTKGSLIYFRFQRSQGVVLIGQSFLLRVRFTFAESWSKLTLDINQRDFNRSANFAHPLSWTININGIRGHLGPFNWSMNPGFAAKLE